MSAGTWPKLSSDCFQFLGRLVDRLDAADLRGASKAQSVPLTKATWPELTEARNESDKEVLWAELCKLHKLGWVRIAPESAARSTSGYASGARVSVADSLAIRTAVGRPERKKSAGERWREAVNEHLVGSEEVKQAVGAYCIELPGRTMAEVAQRLNDLHELKESPLLLREVSAKLFWGLSKVLDGRQRLVAAVLGLDECPFAESPVQLLVQLPAGKVSSVLFIENQASYEQAARSASPALQGVVLVYAAGFKGSALRLRNAAGASVYYAARGQLEPSVTKQFENWLFWVSEEAPWDTYFWGDLDWSGMGILKAMRATFPGIRAWEPGYAPMLDSLVAGAGHSPREAEKQGQLTVMVTGCPYADLTLIPALSRAEKFVDQETVAI